MIGFYIDWAVSTMLGLLHNHKFDAEWDRLLNKLMDEHWDTVIAGECTAKIGPVSVWIANQYYSYGYDSDAPSELAFRPSIKTMGRLSRLHAEAKGKKKADYFERIYKIEGRS